MQQSPDGGLSKFWYDRLGRLVVSQNAKQAVNDQYSYTGYDPLGRIVEVGQLTSSTQMTQAIAKDVEDLADWLSNAASSREQMTRTVYDVAATGPDLCTPPELLCQRNLRNRVSYTYVQPSASYSSNNLSYTSATYYTYDIHGNVDELLQHYNAGIMQSTGNAFKKITYDYDLISGKVNKVSYQPGGHDQFHHRYEYDAENRITKVHTSGDGVIWETDARYYYYRHGPLARTETGDLLVQGTDYAYTLQGWLKGVNSSALDPAHDMGEDGSSTSIVARDVYGFALHYYNTDYSQVNNTKTVFAPVNTTVLTGVKPLFNGNIAAMSVNIGQFNRPLIYNYGYDQLNRLVAMDTYTGLNSSTNAWTPVHTSDYRERISYDGNGNILTYRRFGTTLNGNSLPMDSLDYKYAYDGNGRLLNNQLEYVDDHVSSAYTTDIDDQSPGNYTYDAIGNLISDDQEGISEITWNVYGKISSITKSGPVTITYEYDASGNRIGKTVGNKHTWYVRDASGNVMAVYEDENSSINSGALSQIEVHLYGSARLGICQANRDVENWPAADVISLTGLSEGGVREKQIRGEKIFELNNHLGNVLVTVADRRVEHNTSGTTIDYYEAGVVSASDYYSFGMGMAERKYAAGDYRYGFNGHEKSFDLNLAGDVLTAEFWEFDTRIGRRFNRDPRPVVGFSPYLGLRNSPLVFADPLGDTSVPGVDGKLIGLSPGTFETYDGREKQLVGGKKISPPAGTLRHFTWSGKRFVAFFNSENGEFVAYRNDQDKKLTFEDYFEQVRARAVKEAEMVETAVGLERAGLVDRSLEPDEARKNLINLSLFVTLPSQAGGVVTTRAAGGGTSGTGALKPLGLGSTGRTTAANLTEQLTMKEALSNPAAGHIIQRMKPLTDSRWLGWRKMQYVHTGLDGSKTVIHYNGKWVDGVLKAVDDFKFP